MTPPRHSPRFERAVQLARGEAVARDLAAARREFGAAAEAGDVRAAHVFAGFLAGGIGGPPDWQGALEILRYWASRDPLASRQIELLSAMELTPGGEPPALPPEKRLHPVKNVTLRPGLLTPRECDFLIQISEARLGPATVLASAETARNRPLVRDADHASFNPLEAPPFLHAINRRIAAATRTDVRQGEPIQIMRYRPGQQYRPHVDGVGGGSNKRVKTAIVYLNQDYAGGETLFTELDLAVRGKQGDMLLFENLREDGELDRGMRHAGLPVIHGVKYIASRWILQRAPYDAQGNPVGKTLWS